MAKNDQATTATDTQPPVTNPNPPGPQPPLDSVASNSAIAGNPENPRNPAGAPLLTRPAVDDATQQAAGEELQSLLLKDRSKLSPADLKAHDKHVHELHYIANGTPPPNR